MNYERWYAAREQKAAELSQLSETLKNMLKPALETAAERYNTDPLTGIQVVTVNGDGVEKQPNVYVLCLDVLGRPAVSFTPTYASDGAHIAVKFFGEDQASTFSGMSTVRVSGSLPNDALLAFPNNHQGTEDVKASEFLIKLLESRLNDE
jgi:hypothetical protein